MCGDWGYSLCFMAQFIHSGKLVLGMLVTCWGYGCSFCIGLGFLVEFIFKYHHDSIMVTVKGSHRL
jgi:hypothetical protein